MVRVFMLVLSLSAVTCQKAPAADPEAAYRTFAAALRRGDTKTAYGSLSDATRKAAELHSATIAGATRGAVRDLPELMLLQSGTRPEAVGEVKVIERSESWAILEVGSSTGQARVKLVREANGRWAIDLTHAYPQQVTP